MSNITIRMRYGAASATTQIEGGDNTTVSGTGTVTDPVIVNGIAADYVFAVANTAAYTETKTLSDTGLTANLSNDNRAFTWSGAGNNRLTLSTRGVALFGKPGSLPSIQLESGTAGKRWSIFTGNTPSPGGTADDSLSIGMNVDSSPGYNSSLNTLKMVYETNYTDTDLSLKYDEWYLQWRRGETGLVYRNLYSVFNEFNNIPKIETTLSGEVTFRPTADFTTFGSTPISMMIEESGNVLMGSNPTYNVSKFEVQSSDATYPTMQVGTANLAVSPSIGFYLFKSGDNTRPVYASIKMVGVSATAGVETGTLSFSTRNAGTLAERMVIDQTGKMGLNIAPTATLTISDKNFAAGTTSTGVTIEAALHGGAVSDGLGYGVKGGGGSMLMRLISRIYPGMYSADIDVFDGGVGQIKTNVKVYGDGNIFFPNAPARTSETNVWYRGTGGAMVYGPIGAAAIQVTANGALSAPAISGVGTWITGGTATTTKPYLLIEPTGTTSASWSTAGTGIGVNAPSGFTGSIAEFKLAGATVGTMGFNGTFTVTNNLAASNVIYPTGAARSAITSPSNGVMQIANAALSDFSRLQFGGTTSSFGAIKRNAAGFDFVKADDSGYTFITASKINIPTGSNASIGTSTLVAGTVTVATTAVATGSNIMVSCKTPGGTQGFLSVGTVTNATSFVINSSNAADTSVVNWWIIN